MPNRTIKILSVFFVTIFLLERSAFAGTTPPTTTYDQTPAVPDGLNDWYVTPVQFDLTSTDLESGVKEINYRVDSGTWQKVEFSSALNLAPNPSFEISGATSSGLADWEATLVDVDTTYSQDTTNFVPGYSISSAKIATVTTVPGLWHGINNKQSFAVGTGYDNMTASVWLKTENVNETAYFKVYSIADDGLGGEVITYLGQSGTVSGTTTWTPLSLNFSALPEATTGVYIDIGLTGAGTVWADAVVINSSTQVAETTLIIGSDNENHTLEFYAVDNAGNTEAHSCSTPKTNCVEFKLDSTPPGGWSSAGVIEGGGADHEVSVYTNVKDITSGLSPNTNKFQYTVDAEVDFGVYPILLQCQPPWQSGDWADLESTPPSEGQTQAYLETQRTDFCNSNWQICKKVRFYAEDMAGNNTFRDYCINGPWIRVQGEGVVRSNYNIDMFNAPDDYNTDGLIEAGGSNIDAFTSSTGWEITNSPIPTVYNYSDYWALTGDKTEITGGDLVSTSGIYYINGNFDVTNQSIPASYSNAIFTQIVFISGDLTISNSITTDPTTAALFIVQGDVNISEGVRDIQTGIFSDGEFSTAYDGTEAQTSVALELRGLFAANQFHFLRSLPGNNNNNDPSEDFIYEPKFLIKLRDYFGKHTITWRSAE